ncbi:hypothetical protein IAR55_000742 [Kwoniella newhampshirensis]|uniref:Uncharacterized protein n=1 Tax=Kwoniella newhampshirensis TaxID=1651941 RepID=A0AAW0Z3Y6_9TREE
MHLPASTLLFLLLSLASPLPAEARSTEPKTASPNYKECKHGHDDPKCSPLTSDAEVSYIRDSHGRFKLLNQKRPELEHPSRSARPQYPSTTTSLAEWATHTVPAMVDPTSTTTLMANSAIARRQSETMMDEGEHDGTGDGKFGGGASSWGRPFHRSLSEVDVENKREMTESTTVHTDSFQRGDGGPPFKRRSAELPFPLSPPCAFFLSSAQGSQGTIVQPIKSQNEDTDSRAAESSPTTQQTEASGEDTGNAKWFGRWGRPWKREDTTFTLPSFFPSYSPFISHPAEEDISATSTGSVAQNEEIKTIGLSSHPLSLTQEQDQIQRNPSSSLMVQSDSIQADVMGNAKWGFGSYGRPFKRDDPSTLRQKSNITADTSPSSQSEDDLRTTGPASDSDDTGNGKWFGGWGRPWKRGFSRESTIFSLPFSLGSITSISLPSAAFTSIDDTPGHSLDVHHNEATVDGSVGNAKWGFGHRGRPWARSIAPPLPLPRKRESQEEEEGQMEDGDQTFTEQNTGRGAPPFRRSDI